MSSRWLARLVAALLFVHAFAFGAIRMSMVEDIINVPYPARESRAVAEPIGPDEAPEEIRNAGRMTCATSHCESELALETWLVRLSFLVGLVLLIASFFLPRRPRRTTPFQTPA